jgi:hypothetical protein
LVVLRRGLLSGGVRSARLLQACLGHGVLPVLTACLASAPPTLRAAAAQLAAALVTAPPPQLSRRRRAENTDDNGENADPNGDDDGNDDDDEEEEEEDAEETTIDPRARRGFGRFGRHFGPQDGPGLAAAAEDEELLAALTYVTTRDADPAVRMLALLVFASGADSTPVLPSTSDVGGCADGAACAGGCRHRARVLAAV